MFKVTHHPPPENRFRKHKEKEKKDKKFEHGKHTVCKRVEKRVPRYKIDLTKTQVV
jgi:hypothetical protein